MSMEERPLQSFNAMFDGDAAKLDYICSYSM
jgi:hypothetical protein